MSRKSRSRRSRYDTRYESPRTFELPQTVEKETIEDDESSFLDQVFKLRDNWGDQIAQSLGFSNSGEESASNTDASTLLFSRSDVDSRDDTSDDSSLISERMSKSGRIDVDDYLQQNLKNIYNKQRKEQRRHNHATAKNREIVYGLQTVTSDDNSLSSTDSEHHHSYLTNQQRSYPDGKPLTSCLKTGSALKKSNETNQKNKKRSFHRKRTSNNPTVEKKQVRWMDQFTPDLDPYLFEMRRVYAKEMANVRLAWDEHSVVMEKIMKKNAIPVFCGGMSEM